ncbi:hypothetical protein K431DRAFT_235115 [Polychaeton citri CBS 116435]|uniref:Ca3427-like PBP 2 domain-containing protein n=1 Tax=Polychaeton citri CBS 116435 TaxID=1314669 RepID=A0A9P4UK93_9PEZI|nr:hypothetical protein K431DRAFT_235115 [Polychaeton citri CBS 116435]
MATASPPRPLRIGYIPEHFSTPLFFARKHFDLDAELVPFRKGTADLVAGLKAPKGDSHIDVAIGLTEGFVSDLGKGKAAGSENQYGLVGTYVQSPLCWAISTGAGRGNLQGVKDLKGKKVGVSKIGSGSYVMSFVLADQQGWLQEGAAPFEVVPCGDINALNAAVAPAEGESAKADFFMWEHFTTKYLWDAGALRKIGEIYTPWPSWVIAARNDGEVHASLADLSEKLNAGIAHYRKSLDEAADHISSTMDYTKDDAHAWMETVQFVDDVKTVEPRVIDETVRLLRKAGVLTDASGGSEHMIRS